MRDAGQLLADMHVYASKAPTNVLPDTWKSSFVAAYGETGPTLEFFVLQRVLLHWSKIPRDSQDRGPVRALAAQNITVVAEAYA